MSAQRGKYSGAKQNKRGHGCLGFVLTFTAIVAVLVILFFTTHLFDGLKHTVYRWFYPQKYSEQVERCSEEFGVDEDLIYAVIKTESGFRAEVESHAGAVGLMQLMPETFDWLQENLEGEVIYPAERLKDADINIRYGTYFLSWLLERYGDVGTACAAYNAGITNVDRWLGDSRYSADGDTLSAIPFGETERYVEKVRDALEMYRELYDEE